MANVERGVVRGPNQDHPGNRVNGTEPLQHGAAFQDVPNNRHKGARVDSCGPMGRSASPMDPPNDRAKFHVEDASIGYRGFTEPVASPGRGAIAVEPSNPFGGSLVPAHLLRDTAKK